MWRAGLPSTTTLTRFDRTHTFSSWAALSTPVRGGHDDLPVARPEELREVQAEGTVCVSGCARVLCVRAPLEGGGGLAEIDGNTRETQSTLMVGRQGPRDDPETTSLSSSIVL